MTVGEQLKAIRQQMEGQGFRVVPDAPDALMIYGTDGVTWMDRIQIREAKA